MPVRKEYEKALKAMKEAKTGEEISAAWKQLKPRTDQPAATGGTNPLALYMEKKPLMIFNVHKQYTEILERGILEPKVVFLMMLGFYMMHGHWEGVIPQACNAKAAGATEEEIMEVAAIMGYARSKATTVDTSAALGQAFESAAFKNTQVIVES